MIKTGIINLLFIYFLSTLCDTVIIEKNDNWDILVFTQRWPMTACMKWEEEKPNNTCAFPNPNDLWTVHGIWPTLSGTKGPANCNKTWHFNDTLIEPIKANLTEYWTNIENNTSSDSFWEHEWKKHGTCAVNLPELDNEFKYFSKGLNWIQLFNLKQILNNKQVVPNDQGYSVQDIFDSIKETLNVNPIIQCIVDRHTKEFLLSEVQICFNTDLNLTDCDSVKALNDEVIQYDNLLTNCNVKKKVMYPNRMPPTTTTTEPTTTTITKETNNVDHLLETRDRLITLYKTVKLLIWATI